MLNLKVTKVQIHRTGGTDILYVSVEGPTQFPNMDKTKPGTYKPFFKMELQGGYAEEWLSLMGVAAKDIETIDTRAVQIEGRHGT